jgi:hypothetical protein
MPKKRTKTSTALSKHEIVKARAEADLESFIRLVAPHRVLGSIHEDLCVWWTKPNSSSHQLCLLPRDHGKSAMVAYRAAWEITRNPCVRIIYISSTADLAEKQLGSIKDILLSDKYRRYWPEMVKKEESKRASWTVKEIAVDHPLRKKEFIRDPTVKAAGLTTSLTGFHCDVTIFDDVVVQENAYTEEGRTKAAMQYSLLASVEAADARQWVVGTRYHPKDLYQHMVEMQMKTFDAVGVEVGSKPVYEVYQFEVEDEGTGGGQFLWPRQMRSDGAWFGFDREIWAKKFAQYLDKTQFYAQYYNNPNMYEGGGIKADRFQYYKKEKLNLIGGRWYYGDRLLNLYAAIDFAYSLTRQSDYTALVVIGVDADNSIYVLDIDRFKTDQISEYYEKIKRSHIKWNFRKLRAEINAAQDVIVKDLKTNYIKVEGLSLSVDPHRPTKSDGSKEERIRNILQPRYANMSVWHYRGGNCQTLEEELMLGKPPHDDVKDALASAVDISAPPRARGRVKKVSNVVYHPRFGGIQH